MIPVDRRPLELLQTADALRDLASRIEEDWPEICPPTSAIAEMLLRKLLRTLATVAFRNPTTADVNGKELPMSGEYCPAKEDSVLAERLDKAAYLCTYCANPDHRHFAAEQEKRQPLHKRLIRVADCVAREGMQLTPAEVRLVLDCDYKTLSKYARLAGVAVPARGGRNHTFSIPDVRKIANAILQHSTNVELRTMAEEAKKEIGV